jgi:hypothetical protein
MPGRTTGRVDVVRGYADTFNLGLQIFVVKSLGLGLLRLALRLACCEGRPWRRWSTGHGHRMGRGSAEAMTAYAAESTCELAELARRRPRTAATALMRRLLGGAMPARLPATVKY